MTLRNLSRNTDAVLLRTVRRWGRHPRFRALESLLCGLFLILFALVLYMQILRAALR